MQGTDASRVAWVTGAAGFIGPHVAARLERDGWRVVGIDRAPMVHTSGVVGEITPSVLDQAARRLGPPALVFHAAGVGTVGASACDPAGSHRDTVTSVETVVAWLRVHAPSALFILPSSAAVYGDAGSGPLSEETPLAPISVYGRHKRDAERAALAAAEQGLRVSILRLFSVYGRGLRKQLPWDLSRKLLVNPTRLELFGTGAETRDYFAASDVADLVAFLALSNVSVPLVVNGGTGVPTHTAAFAAAFAKAWGAAPVITFNGEARAEDPRHLYADTSRLTALGFASRGELQPGLQAYVEWLREA